MLSHFFEDFFFVFFFSLICQIYGWYGSERFVIFFISIMVRNSHVDSIAKHLMNLRPVFVSFSFFFKSIVFQNLTFTLWHTNNEFPSIFTTLLFCYDFFQLPKFDSLLGYNSKFHQPASFTFINFLKLLNFSIDYLFQ